MSETSHSTRCQAVAAIARITPAEVHNHGGVPDCPPEPVLCPRCGKPEDSFACKIRHVNIARSTLR